MKKNILFITWDGPQTSYAEGLFMPIFHKIEQLYPSFQFHILQFTWGNQTQNQIKASKLYHIPYESVQIHRKPWATLGSLFSLFSGTKHIQKAINQWDIDILMPRSLFPAFMVNRGNFNLPIIFDADGLPIEERIDFAGLKRNSLMHKALVSMEKKAIIQSDYVITRSMQSIAYHINKYGAKDEHKFSVVINGRDTLKFKPNKNLRQEVRNELGIDANAMVFLYVGSFGPQYGWNEMLGIFESYIKQQPNAHFLLLTGSPEKVTPLIPENLVPHFTVKKVPYQEVAKYMNAGDIAFAIREPKPSMLGVAPIKLAEYLLMNLPTIASSGIGDTNRFINIIPGIFAYHHINPPTYQEILDFIENSNNLSDGEIRNQAIDMFSLEAAAKSYFYALKYLI